MQIYKNHSPLPSPHFIINHLPPPSFYGIVSIFAEGHFIMTPPHLDITWYKCNYGWLNTTMDNKVV